ncbi:TBC1 domain family member 5 [Vidua chalybeata]|uniref:TBC1 domain family member 5 n=1 Tax=Vidua chalybeata TaxID=81927 RepID=UPI0023A8CCC6|nr:TBC1 domain family member 5 [Vidua chalybeata]XP_053823546.1 TBC1 domain family member 5 [Vidua chalybeata]XP_053823554.1 TBC1 domain family member 5 [Vidua chalybeata]XP_053823563.1 TBC1 domain family member 5 [Vidua chalybeata]XP_053823571.1 TBC1 domain family member 5 [Vidua chalybeata]XP_053823579.1 TBC1 domain family member 5 [Vidua chalybeata]
MFHSVSETSHPLQTEEQEIGIDPLQSFLNKPGEGGSNENGSTPPTSDSDGTFISYSKEWEELFVNNNYLATIRLKGINGQLRSSRFRSVCWKLFLDVLPQDRSQWIKTTSDLRTSYSKIKEIHITNPRKAGQQDLIINNPLSQDEGSLWNKFFQDKELRAMIEQDVTRTFPEMQYFQQENVRKILTDVLFCYARENEQLLYKQGMHELLAPIVFILHCDHQAFSHASEAAQPSEEMKVLLNPEYLEHDAYAMFTCLMKTAEHWFSTFEHDSQKEKDVVITPMPFARPQDLGPSIAIVAKVNQIQDHLLKKHDIELYMHLNRLEIAPQIYGLRWVRLLFGREFPLQDLLVVWDALFADSITLNLVDYIFVAMLLYIRDALISSNYQTCLGLLMHYPPVGDVHSLILRALFLRDPKRNPRPVTHQFQQNLDYYKARGADLMNKTRASAKATPLNINKVSNSLLNFGRKLIAPAMASGGAVGTPASGSSFPPSSMPSRSTVEAPQHQQHHHQHQQHHHQSQQQRMMKSESMPVQLGKGQSSKNISSSPSIESLSGGREFTGSPPLSASKKDSFFSTISRSRSQSKTMSRKESEEELEAQISFLQGQLNDLEAMCKYCAKMMNTHLGNIQEVILQERLEKEDEILVSLAGLKQIKDILKGSLRFNQSQLEAEENEQITIADDHYCSNNQNKGAGDVLKGPVMTKQQFISGQQTATDPSTSESKSADDYIMVSKEEERSKSSVPEPVQALQAHKEAAVKPEAPSHSSLIFSDPLMGSISASSSNLSSSPDDDSSNNSKDSDFAIVSPLDI